MLRRVALAFLLVLNCMALPAEKQVSDDRLHDQVLMKLAGDSEVKGGGMEVEVHDGVVTLKGKVDTEKRRMKAERLVKKIKGVTGVNNQLAISK